METIQASSYTSLSPYSPSKQPSYFSVLDGIINALPSAVHPLQRELLLEALLDDLSSNELPSELKHLLLTAVKTLGRNPISSEILAEDSSLTTLLSYASLPSSSYSSTPPRAVSPSKPRSSLSLPALHRPSSSSPSAPPPHLFGSPSSLEALRILANCLLLHEKARDGLISVGGGEGLVRGLGIEAGSRLGNGKSSKKEDGEPNPPTPEMAFILGRILFLTTARPSPFILKAVDELSILPALVNRLSHPPFPAPPADPTPEILKLTFNILLYYPKLSPDRVPLQHDGSYEIGISGDDGRDDDKGATKSIIGDLWEEKLDCLLEPLLSLLCTYPFPQPALTSLPLPPTLAQTIHALLTFPTSPLATIWSPPPPPPKSTSTSLFTRFTPSRSRSPSPAPELNVAGRLFDLVEALTRPWEAPPQLDEDGIEIGSEDGKGRGKGVKEVEEGLAPLFLVLARACSVEDIRVKVKELIVPDDLDRSADSTPLERRPDVLGRMLRLMLSPVYPQTKIAVGEVFFVLAERNASNMSELVGYGNAAGFLFSKGFTSVPPPTEEPSAPKPPPKPKPTSSPSKSKPSAAPINPMTGLNASASTAMHDTTMTDEEKEREAERLFVLFERMEKNPAVSMGTGGEGGKMKNPVREAVESGKYGELEDVSSRLSLPSEDSSLDATFADRSFSFDVGQTEEVKRQLDLQDERDEAEAIKEMEAHKARKARQKEEAAAAGRG
ncbi:guanine nucleotide exchange factor [Mrakia frigida]|uniref:synembryn n=1 Tax=Mrakia frigida TaxID=29902 RepID=UPI003FCC19A7